MAMKEPECPPEGAPLWVVTYGDMMSLLLTFFIMLVSISQIEITKFEAAVSSIKGGFGIFPKQAGIMTEIKMRDAQTQAQETEEFIEEVSSAAQATEMQDGIEIYNSPKGLRLIISDSLLFTSGSANINPRFAQLLSRVGVVIGKMKLADIKVEGHTDNVPIETEEFPSNWELSSARALRVTKYLAFNVGIDPKKLSAVGYGEYRPRDTNDTAAGRGRNRRVEIFLERKEPLEPVSTL